MSVCWSVVLLIGALLGAAVCDLVSITVLSMQARSRETVGVGNPDPSCQATLQPLIPGANVRPVGVCKFQTDVSAGTVTSFSADPTSLLFAANVSADAAVSVTIALLCSEQNCDVKLPCEFDDVCAVAGLFADDQLESGNRTFAFVRGQSLDVLVPLPLYNMTFRLAHVVSPTESPVRVATTTARASVAPPTSSTTTQTASESESDADADTASVSAVARTDSDSVSTSVVIGAAVGGAACFLAAVLAVIFFLLKREQRSQRDTATAESVQVVNNAYHRVSSPSDGSRESFAVPDAPSTITYDQKIPAGYTSLTSPPASAAAASLQDTYANASEMRERKKDLYVEAPAHPTDMKPSF
jgi:hypothetical protein